MTRFRIAFALVAVIAFVGVGGAGSFFGQRAALAGLRVVDATPDQLAVAMRDDRFYSDYNEDTLVVEGVVRSVTSSGSGAILQFLTQTNYTTSCEFETYPGSVHPNATITVITEGATAARTVSGVLLSSCRLAAG